MSIKVEDGDFSCFSIDDDTAVLKVKNQSFVMDYSTLMDMLINLSVVASQVEQASTCCQLVETSKTRRYH